MKRVEVLTLFPELFSPFLSEGLIGRAIREDRLGVETIPLRPYGLGRHNRVDDVPYGGGAGMVLRPEPVYQAVREREALHKKEGRGLWKILLTPQGRTFDQTRARELVELETPLLFICGRYEGFDERIREGLPDEEISLGDFILLGGEVAALAILEAIARLIPGVLGNPESSLEESFSGEGLEYPQYTRPAEFEGMTVPDILLSGNHEAIAQWRAAEARKRTESRRPDLLKAGRMDHKP